MELTQTGTQVIQAEKALKLELCRAGLINKWNPIALYGIHGFVQREFLIEPAAPPHDPNFRI